MKKVKFIFVLLCLISVMVFSSTSVIFAQDSQYDETDQIYYLPYQYGFTSFCAQGNYGTLSHQGLNKAAVDFLMPVGTQILAARDGVVTEVITSNKRTILNYFTCPNNEIIVMSDDGTYARYVHLQYDATPEVHVGQYVEQGQLIAYSGNSGNSMAPHLHFEVFCYNDIDQQVFMIARFIDVKSNNGIPVFGGFYTSGNK